MKVTNMRKVSCSLDSCTVSSQHHFLARYRQDTLATIVRHTEHIPTYTRKSDGHHERCLHIIYLTLFLHDILKDTMLLTGAGRNFSKCLVDCICGLSFRYIDVKRDMICI